MAGPSYPGQREARGFLSDGNTPASQNGAESLSAAACKWPGPAHLEKAVWVPFIPAQAPVCQRPTSPLISQEEEGLLPWNGPQGWFLCHCRVAGRKWNNGLRNRCRRLNRNCWKPSSPSCGTTEKANLEGQGDQGWRPCSAMKAMLLESGTRVLTESQVLICEVGTIRLLISKVEICITG